MNTSKGKTQDPQWDESRLCRLFATALYAHRETLIHSSRPDVLEALLFAEYYHRSAGGEVDPTRTPVEAAYLRDGDPIDDAAKWYSGGGKGRRSTDVLNGAVPLNSGLLKRVQATARRLGVSQAALVDQILGRVIEDIADDADVAATFRPKL